LVVMMRRVWAVLAITLGVGIVAASVPLVWAAAPKMLDYFRADSSDTMPIRTADLSGSGPGSLISATTMPGFMRTVHHAGLQAARVVYRSTSGDDGRPTVVSGTVFTPAGPAPEGGWPVLSFGHGTTGIDEPCAPSLSDSLLGFADPVAGLTKSGYAVALADYQGLGSDGVHPYSDARTEGRNMIDVVRALRSTFKNVSNRWAAFGGSQGGGAAWSADEQASIYAPELELVGAATISPAADMSGLVDKAQAGTMTNDQQLVFQAIVESIARLHPDVNRDDYRDGAAAKYWDILTACSGNMVHDRASAAKQLQAHDLTPKSPAAVDRVRQILKQWALPQQPLSAPLFVWYGGRDTFIDADWTTAAIRRACEMGGTVVWRFDPDKGHSEADWSEQLNWLADRFAGKPAGNDCG
jgi:hypothetical protein